MSCLHMEILGQHTLCSPRVSSQQGSQKAGDSSIEKYAHVMQRGMKFCICVSSPAGIVILNPNEVYLWFLGRCCRACKVPAMHEQ